jgi:hypothetical protein
MVSVLRHLSIIAMSLFLPKGIARARELESASVIRRRFHGLSSIRKAGLKPAPHRAGDLFEILSRTSASAGRIPQPIACVQSRSDWLKRKQKTRLDTAMGPVHFFGGSTTSKSFFTISRPASVRPSFANCLNSFRLCSMRSDGSALRYNFPGSGFGSG